MSPAAPGGDAQPAFVLWRTVDDRWGEAFGRVEMTPADLDVHACPAGLPDGVGVVGQGRHATGFRERRVELSRVEVHLRTDGGDPGQLQGGVVAADRVRLGPLQEWQPLEGPPDLRRRDAGPASRLDIPSRARLAVLMADVT